MSCFRTACRVAAGIYFVVVLLAVLWDSGSEIAELTARAMEVVRAVARPHGFNLGMLAPLTLLAHLGWPRTAWWHWALAGCALGAGAELAQWALPFLLRRATWVNIAENAVGAWAGALAAHVLWHIRRRMQPQP